MKWIWFLLFLAMVGEIMDNMEYADAAKKKKKKVTKKKKGKKSKPKAKKKPTTRRPGAANPNPSNYLASDPSLIFYSPMPPGFAANSPGAVPAGPKGGAINYAMPYSSVGGGAEPIAAPVTGAAPAAITGPKGVKKNGWFQMARQKRYINEDALILEHLGLIDKGKINEFGLDRSKRSFRMLKVAGTRNGLDNQDSDSAAVDENNNVTQKSLKEIRRKRDLEKKLKKMQAKRQDNRDKLRKKQEDVKNQLNRPKRSAVPLDKDKLQEQRDKIRQAKEKLQQKHNETKGPLNNRPKRDANRESVQANREEMKDTFGKPKQKANLETIKDKIQNKQQDTIEKLSRSRRESPIERAKDKLETRLEKQQKKHKQKQAKRNERRQKLNANRNQTEPAGRPQAKPTFEAQVMPNENTEIRMKRAIDAEVPKLQALNPEDEDSSSSEECIGEDCSSDESCIGADCSDDSVEDVEPLVVHSNDQIRFRRDIPNYKMTRVDIDAAKMKLTQPKLDFAMVPPRTKRVAEIAGALTVPTDEDSYEECIGENCLPSEECIGDDCTYEDSDESEEPPEVIPKRQAESDGPLALLVRQKREIMEPKRTGFGSPKQTDFMVRCDGGTDYGDYGTDDYGGNDQAERRRRKGRRKNRNNRNNRRDRNNRIKQKRKNNRPNRKQQSPTSMDQANTLPYAVASATSFAPYSPTNEAVTSSGFDVMPPPASFNPNSVSFSLPEASFSMVHALRKRQVNQRETTTVPSRSTARTRPPRSLVTTRPIRQVPKSKPSENQPRGPRGGKPERGQRSDPSELQGKKLERQKREFDPIMVLTQSSMPPQLPILSDTSNNSNYSIFLGSPIPQILSVLPEIKVKREAPSERPERNPEGERYMPKGKEGDGLIPDKFEAGSKRPDRLKRDLDPSHLLYSPAQMLQPILTDEEISTLWNSNNTQQGVLELSRNSFSMAIPYINAENHTVDRPKRDLPPAPMPIVLYSPPQEYMEIPKGTLDIPAKRVTYDILPDERKVKREAHEARQPNPQRERGSANRPEGDKRNERIGGDRPSRPPRKDLNNRPRRPDSNERPKRSPDLNFEEKSSKPLFEDIQNRMMASLPEEDPFKVLYSPGPNMPQFGIVPNLPILNSERNEAIGNAPLIERQRREVPPRERPAPKEDGKVPRQRQRHQKEDRPKRESPLPPSQSVTTKLGNQENLLLPSRMTIQPDLLEGVDNAADNNIKLNF